jgi:hypothetical protein
VIRRNNDFVVLSERLIPVIDTLVLISGDGACQRRKVFTLKIWSHILVRLHQRVAVHINGVIVNPDVITGQPDDAFDEVLGKIARKLEDDDVPTVNLLEGSTESTSDPGAPNANLFTSRWSPTRRLSAMEGVGILNAWTMNVVPNNARITVIVSDSKYSRAVDFLNLGSVISLQFLDSVFGSSLFRSPFREPDSTSNDSALMLHFDCE